MIKINIKTDWGPQILCLIRLCTSLLGRGWDTLSEPIRTLLRSAKIYLRSAKVYLHSANI